ncbi:hypothetical protein [Olleya sp. HaHaR_3_96]|uniref:hypothetical protein n=1 Tax=Olleya sp. HaHaR_3_96 TaxID=2745560 RepID=UPI001C4FBB09|nr:hypothetical protein [Olleya sp. HaHaR_3_96]QXP59076.1 hypothetical protein H0I26_14275 [Olleya sp. HaHaR_3_96]
MDSYLIIGILIFNLVILIITIISKKGLYTISPEKQWRKEIDAFDKNFKTLEKLDLSDYKINNTHLY